MPIADSPPTSPTIRASGFVHAGVTTIVWGTQGLAVFAGTPGGDIDTANNGYYIIIDYKQRLKKDIDYGENGSGVECRRTTIVHGQTWDITVEDNTQMTPPTQNTAITCYDILAKGTASPLVAKAVWTATIIESEYTSAPKRPGIRTLTAENLTLVDSQA